MKELVPGRGLVHRGGTTLMIWIVALVAAAAAAAGPVYYQAAKISVLRDSISSAPPIGRDIEADRTGPVASTLPFLETAVQAELDRDLGSSTAARLLQPAVGSIEGIGAYPPEAGDFTVVWRTGMCAHLRIRGACPVKANQIIVSRSVAGPAGWHIGQRISGTGWPPLTITGIYQPPDLNTDYWAPRATAYFPLEDPVANGKSTASLDAVFTPRATMTAAPPAQQGTAVIVSYLKTGNLQPADITLLQSGIGILTSGFSLSAQSVVATSSIPDTFAQVAANWRTVGIPVFLVTMALLTLTWLLLFTAVTEAAEARAGEVALAKLRGHGRWRALLFGLSEHVALLAAAFPAGILVGWAAGAGLTTGLLRPGTPAPLPPLAVLAAAAATLGGFTAVILAARRTLRRGVVEQFRHTGQRATDRGWVVDSILVTGCAAGLLDLLLTGQIGAVGQNVLSLLVPGLLGLAVAVVASRLLPLAGRACYGLTSRRHGLAGYLAVRHLVRRPGGVRTTIVLATAFALAAFAVTAWSVGRSNYQLVAGTQVGAATVLTVSVPPGRDLATIVDRADPSGRLATAVDTNTSVTTGTSGYETLAVDPARFARIAFWQPRLGSQPLATLAARLAPPAPRPLVLTGDALRARIRVKSLSVPGERLYANVTNGSSPVTLGALPAHGTVTLTHPLVGCPCVLESLALSPSFQELDQRVRNPVSAILTITALEAREDGRWTPVPAPVLHSAGRWREDAASRAAGRTSAGPAGVTWSVGSVPGAIDPTLDSVNTPAVLPALMPASLLAGRTGVFSGVGLDGSTLPLRPVAAVGAVPGAPGNGVIVDRRYAELAAGENFAEVTQQVWLAPGALKLIAPRLRAAGVAVTSVRSAAALAGTLQRQGPALASALFLADAGVAAVLAAAAAVFSLYLSARRRRYEYAALVATGVSRRALRGAVLAEVAVVLVFGIVVGVATGVASAVLVLRNVPEFVNPPVAPPLSYVPPAAPLAALLSGAAGLLLAVAVMASLALIRGVRLEQLREGPA